MNDTLEDVISKSSKDLDNYIKKFHNQVKEVYHWDQKINENSQKVLLITTAKITTTIITKITYV